MYFNILFTNRRDTYMDDCNFKVIRTLCEMVKEAESSVQLILKHTNHWMLCIVPILQTIVHQT